MATRKNGRLIVEMCTSSDRSSDSDATLGYNKEVNVEDGSLKRKTVSKRPTMKKKKTDPVPPGFNVSLWVNGYHTLEPLSPFDKDAVGIIPDIPDDANELFFLNLFITDKVLEDITCQTNLYAEQFFSANLDKLSNVSRMRFVGGTSVDRIKVLIALQYYMGIVRKPDVKDYWLIDKMMSTPFVRKMMSRDEFHNKGYDPQKKLGNLYISLCDSFRNMWAPRQHPSIDEGAIPFKGRVAFQCFNPSKPDKYHIKSFKVVDSSNNYCVVFDTYVGNQYEETLSEFGATHDRVMKLMADNVDKNHILFNYGQLVFIPIFIL